MAKKKKEYPGPQEDQRVTCSGCNGSKTVAHARKGGGFIFRTCQGCNGKGYFEK